MAADEDPAFIEKLTKGPVAVLTVMQSGRADDGAASSPSWFLYSLVVSIFAAYVAGRALPRRRALSRRCSASPA